MATERKLQRSREERVLAGVCGGLGEYFGADPVLFRVLFVLLTVMGVAPGVVVYIILWIVMPEGEANRV